MKKIVLWIIVLIMTVSLFSVFSLTGCKQEAVDEEMVGEETEEVEEEEAAEEETEEAEEEIKEVMEVEEGAEITILTPMISGEDKFKDMFMGWISGFEEAYSVKVNPTTVGWDTYTEKYETLLASGNPPDVFGPFPPTFYVRFLDADLLLPLDDHLDIGEATDGFATIQTEVLPGLADDGKTYGLIFYANLFMWYYNPNLLGAGGYGWPGSLDEFETMIAGLTTEDVKGMGLAWTPGAWVTNHNNLVFWVYGLGGDFFKDGMPQFDSEEVIQAVSLLKKYYDAGYTTRDTDPQAVRKIMASGGVGCMNGNSNEFGIAQSINPDLTVDDLEMAEWFTDDPSYFAIVQTFAGASVTKYPKATAKFIEYIMNFENQRELFVEAGTTVARTDVFDDEAVRQEVLELRPNTSAIFEIAKHSKFLIPPDFLMMPNNQQVIESWCNWTEKVLYDDMDPAEAMQSMQQEALDLIGL
jgi:ABC-type glycerol-3-phosphate transport system substrate-binding protein